MVRTSLGVTWPAKEVSSMGRIGAGELVIVLLVVLILFGARKLPELARSLGASAKEFRKGIAEGASEDTTTDPD